MNNIIPVEVKSVSTALPKYHFSQAEAAAVAKLVFEKHYSDFQRIANVFETSGIQTRYCARPVDWYQKPLSWADRQKAYIDVATELHIEAAQRALDSAKIDPKSVAAIVTISSTGIATPSLEARTISALGLSSTVQRVPVFGLGCAGGVSGLRIASDLARAHLGKPVLLVTVELCTLSFRSDAATKSNIVATALFGDGAAACILQAHKAPSANSYCLTHSQEHLFPDTLDLMGWNVDDVGLEVIFARSIPDFAKEHVANCVNSLIAEAGIDRGQIERFICHPGGAKVVQAIESALDLSSGTLAAERETLANYGNMSAPTVLFVLKDALEKGLPKRSVMLAMGPGFTISSALLEQF